MNHHHTAQQLRADITALENMLHPITVGKARTFASIKDSILNTADWHQRQADKQKQQLNLQQAHSRLKQLPA